MLRLRSLRKMLSKHAPSPAQSLLHRLHNSLRRRPKHFARHSTLFLKKFQQPPPRPIDSSLCRPSLPVQAPHRLRKLQRRTPRQPHRQPQRSVPSAEAQHQQQRYRRTLPGDPNERKTLCRIPQRRALPMKILIEQHASIWPSHAGQQQLQTPILLQTAIGHWQRRTPPDRLSPRHTCS